MDCFPAAVTVTVRAWEHVGAIATPKARRVKCKKFKGRREVEKITGLFAAQHQRHVNTLLGVTSRELNTCKRSRVPPGQTGRPKPRDVLVGGPNGAPRSFQSARSSVSRRGTRAADRPVNPKP